jgi:hypothetical protein
MRHPVVNNLKRRLGFRMSPQGSISIDCPPIAGYGPLPESFWLIAIGIAAMIYLAVLSFR